MSSHSEVASPEITFAPEHSSGTGKIWKVLGLLTVITFVELAMGYSMTKQANLVDRHSGLGTFFVGAIVILSLAKAYYIVSVFMHLGNEIKNFRLTIVTTLALFIWFVTAFLWDGDSWKNLRNTNAGSREAPKVEQHAAPAVETTDKK